MNEHQKVRYCPRATRLASDSRLTRSALPLPRTASRTTSSRRSSRPSPTRSSPSCSSLVPADLSSTSALIFLLTAFPPKQRVRLQEGHWRHPRVGLDQPHPQLPRRERQRLGLRPPGRGEPDLVGPRRAQGHRHRRLFVLCCCPHPCPHLMHSLTTRFPQTRRRSPSRLRPSRPARVPPPSSSRPSGTSSRRWTGRPFSTRCRSRRSLCVPRTLLPCPASRPDANSPSAPALLQFDGRLILDARKLRDIGFEVSVIGSGWPSL
jgi:hypothetical protein